jgi:hypothetical protein
MVGLLHGGRKEGVSRRLVPGDCTVHASSEQHAADVILDRGSGGD